MAQPAADPVTRDTLKAWIGIADNANDDELTMIAGAVSVMVRRLPTTQYPDDPPPAAWPTDVQQGALMLGSRLFRRRKSPSGVEAFGADGPVYVQRNDPDVAQLLQLGAYAPPAVG